MMRIRIGSVGFLVCALVVTGCDSTNSAAKKAEEEAKKAAGEVKDVAKGVKQSARETADEARLAFLKPVEEALPSIEKKIEGLSGESATKAKEKLEDFKKLLGQVKSASPDKWQSLRDELTKSFDELKKLAGV